MYGGKISGLLLSVLARLFTAYLQHTGFSLGVEDILVVHKSEAKRREVIEEGKRCGNESAMEALNVEKRFFGNVPFYELLVIRLAIY